ncbi:MAG: outer membrane protein transport protein [Verrucomicrobia bacterium]|nr:outer membrane protein transport protein [Verrucomicrobiota bacterium]
MIALKKSLMVLLAGVPSTLLANGFRLVSQDAFAAARGEAFVATADNPSAIHYNPAGLTQLDGQQVRLGAYALYFDPTFTPPCDATNAGTTYHIEKKDALAPQLYYAYAWPDSPIHLGLGIYAPHGASVTWPQDTGFRAVAIEGELTYLRINPVIACEIRPGLSLAAGVMIDSTNITLAQGLRRTAQPFKNSFSFEGDDLSTGFNLGLLWRINEKLSFGATFRSAVTLGFEGQTHIEQQPVIRPTALPAETEMEFPCTAVVGFSYRPTPQWNIEIDADYSNWSSIDTFTIRQKEKPPFPVQQDIPVTLDFKDSWILKLGATRYFDDGWYASAGYLFNQNSVPDDYYSPVAADLDRHVLTLGLGRKWSKYSVDLAYQFCYGPDRTVKDSQPSSTPGRFAGQTADGTYGFISHGLLVSVGMRF